MEISHSKPVAELEPEPRSFDSKPSTLVYRRAAEPPTTTETHFIRASVWDGSLVTRQHTRCQLLGEKGMRLRLKWACFFFFSSVDTYKSHSVLRKENPCLPHQESPDSSHLINIVLSAYHVPGTGKSTVNSATALTVLKFIVYWGINKQIGN